MIYTLEQSIEAVMRRLKLPFRFVPWESETEIALREYLEFCVAEGVEIASQVKAKTTMAEFHMDVVLKQPGGRRIAIECDAPRYHADWLRDLCRDSLCVGSGYVDAVFRFNNSDLALFRTEVMALLLAVEPWIFRATFAEAIRGIHPTGTRRRVRCRRLDGRDERLKQFLEFAKRFRGMPFPAFVEKVRAEFSAGA